MERKEKTCEASALLLRRRQDAFELCLELLRGALEKLELLLVLTLLRLPALSLAALNLILGGGGCTHFVRSMKGGSSID